MLVPLSDWALIRAEGADAASFLQAQLCSDVESLAVGRATLSGYCSPKGRLLASFIAWRLDPETFMLACSRDLLAATLRRLSMFVLRARCRLSDVSEQFTPMGGTLPELPAQVARAEPMQVVDGWIRLLDVGGAARGMKITPGTAAPSTPPQADEASMARWRLLEIQSGVPRIVAATADMFVPQMINFELVGGVSFSKGCYPGQEIVARSQYRGTLKRRMHLFAGSVGAKPGDEVFHDSDAAQPAGTVVDSASSSDEHAVLASVKSALFDVPGAWHLVSPQGPVIEHRSLPYAVPHAAQPV